jgi:hypothetical protein
MGFVRLAQCCPSSHARRVPVGVGGRGVNEVVCSGVFAERRNQPRMSQAVSNTGRTLADGCTGAFTHATRMLGGEVVAGLAGANDVCFDHGDKPCQERLRLGHAAPAPGTSDPGSGP